jgi:O-acetyl-ADP-ribose deacetylase (regulator of RNase III)
MKEANGDLWGMRVDAVCITTNGVVVGNEAAMGGGCALEARHMFPGIARELGSLITAHGNHVFHLATPRHGWYDGENGEEHTTEVIAFPVKQHWRQAANLDLIEQSAEELVKLTEDWSWESVAIPRPGCGLGRLKWEEVKPLIEPILDDRFIVVTF